MKKRLLSLCLLVMCLLVVFAFASCDGIGAKPSGSGNEGTSGNQSTSSTDNSTIGGGNGDTGNTCQHVEETIPATEPTCTEAGLGEGKKCSICGEITVEQETIPAKGHNYVNGYCADCNYERISEGLELELNEDGASYTVLSEGDCDDTEIYIPSTYNDLPVTSIGDAAFRYCEELISVTIPNSVTSIGEEAFYGCEGLTSVTIPNSVTSIGKSAFCICDKLASIEIPNSVTSIGDAAFSNCSKLASVTIPDSVTSIGRGIFFCCDSLTSIVIPDSVTSIGKSAFGGCTSLTSITIPFVGATRDGTEITYFGYIFGASKYSENKEYVPSSLKEVIITGGSEIGEFTFYDCDSLTSIVIPDSVTSIGRSAFGDCASLTSITIPFVGATKDGAESTYFGYIFGASEYSKNKEYVPDSLKEVIITGGSEIGEFTFYDCDSLTSVTIPDSVTEIGEYAFCSCASLTSVTIGDSVTSIGESAFNNCKSFTSITIPNSVTSTGYYAFCDCRSLTIYCEATSQPSGWSSNWNTSSCPVVWDCNNNDVADDGYIYTVIDGVRYEINGTEATVVFQPINITKADILSSITYKDANYAVTSVNGNAFYGCTGLTSVTVPDSVTSIGESAFEGCTSLTSVTISNSVTNIGERAFFDCDSLTSVTIGNSVTNIGERAFFDCGSLTSITIPDSVTSIGTYAFYNCTSLTSITIPDSVTSLGEAAFRGCCWGLTIYCEAKSRPSEWEVDWNYSVLPYEPACPVVWDCNNNDVADNGYIYTVVDGIRYGIKDGVATVMCRRSSNIKEANISSNVTYEGNVYKVTSLEEGAFAFCENLTSITIPNSITIISDSAFQDCTSLVRVTIPDGVTEIGGHAFNGCTSLTSVTIPDSVTSIGGSAFRKCTSLTRVIIPDSVTYIGMYAFYDNSRELKVYCEAKSEPSGWSSSWDKLDSWYVVSVVWGYKK